MRFLMNKQAALHSTSPMRIEIMSFACGVCFVTKLFDIGHGMSLQFNFFEHERRSKGNFPEGFHYEPALIGPADEDVATCPCVFLVTWCSGGAQCL